MKITVHPLFFATIIFCAIFGGLMMTIIYVLTALLHECGHVFCAARMGYTFKKIKLMPYGASAICDIDGISVKDEIALALAGPAVNLFICVGVAGLWWFVPESYAYTDIIMQANAAMLICNLLPAYPLDGGRVARLALSAIFGERAANIAQRTLTVILAALLVAAFFIYGYNFTFLCVAAFLLSSAFEKNSKAIKLNFSTPSRLKRGIDVKYVLVDENLTFKDAAKFLDERHYVVFQLYRGGIADEITQDELYEKMSDSAPYDKVFGKDFSDRPFKETI